LSFRSGKKRKAAEVSEPAAKRAKAANGLAVAANGKKHEESSSEEDSSSDEEAVPAKKVAAGRCLFVPGGRF
jgi:hypothetical protein